MNGKNVWKPLCLVFAALFALSWVFFGFLYYKGGVDFSALKNSEQNYTADNGGAIIGEGESNGIALMSAEIPVEEFAEYDVSPMAETAYTLTATVTPVNAVDKTVDWSVAFVNPASAWATGKTVTDYVTVTPTSDGALTANVECLQAFSEQIEVTVASREFSSVKATCTVDYAQKITGMRVYFEPNASGGSTVDIPEGEEVSIPITYTQRSYVYILRARAVLSDVYTIAESATCSVLFDAWSGSIGGRKFFNDSITTPSIHRSVDGVADALDKGFPFDTRMFMTYHFQRENYTMMSGEYVKTSTVGYGSCSSSQLADFWIGNMQPRLADEGTTLWTVRASVEGKYGSYEREESYIMYELDSSILASNMDISLSDTSYIF